MGRTVRGAVPMTALVLGVLVSGCSSETKRTGADPEPRGGETPQARKAGPRDSGCALPVSFDLPPGWQATATAAASASADPERKEFSLVCELRTEDPPGVAPLRVWTAPTAGRTPEQALKSLVDGVTLRLKQSRYSSVRTGASPITEAVFTESPGQTDDEDITARAFAVGTPDGIVAVQLGGMGASEDPSALPAYELARKSARAGG
ncbi:lipoprotein [Streptomyces sp. NPDC000594]|uniref:lipoprotein n=1 Tax=Streptomyces sp. NPDC000594 TaxID=3154261 RepID=UPI0033195350